MKEPDTLAQSVKISAVFPPQIDRGDTFFFHITLMNSCSMPFTGITLSLDAPETMAVLSPCPLVFDLAAGETRTLCLEALALAGGRGVLRAAITCGNSASAACFTPDISGDGYYSGDNHSHSKCSDGVNTVTENADNAYLNMHSSWLWSTEHNSDAQLAETRRITEHHGGTFISACGLEITTGYTYNPPTPSGEKRGHALIYGYPGVPRLVISEKGGAYDWQASINDVIRAGGLFYLAHPFDQTFPFDNACDWRGHTGIEVWNGSVHVSHENAQKAFALWDRLNMLGEKKYLGTAGTDSHISKTAGGLGMCGHLERLTGETVLGLLRSGESYGTNGPDLRFSVGGGAMGSTVSLTRKGRIPVSFEAKTEYGTLTSLRIFGFPITGSMDSLDRTAAVLYELDLSQEQKTEVCGTVNVEVDRDMFFRMEVKSTAARTDSIATNGPEAGTGFAFSNPVWVTIGQTGTTRIIRSISYDGAAVTPEHTRFGVKTLTVPAPFDASKLVVDAGNAHVKIVAHPVAGHKNLQLLDLLVSAGEYTTMYSYLVQGSSIT